MSKKPGALAGYIQPYRYPSPKIPLRAIRAFARRIAQRFDPDKIVLFGSYAYGTPHAESDGDLLGIMPTQRQMQGASATPPGFGTRSRPVGLQP